MGDNATPATISHVLDAMHRECNDVAGGVPYGEFLRFKRSLGNIASALLDGPCDDWHLSDLSEPAICFLRQLNIINITHDEDGVITSIERKKP